MHRILFLAPATIVALVTLLASEVALACAKVEQSCASEEPVPFWIIVVVCGGLFLVARTLWEWWNGIPNIGQIATDDPRMIRARELAHQTLSQFWDRYSDPADGEEDFSLKIAHETEFGRETIWVGEISNRNGQLFGRFVNESISEQFVLGQTVRFDEEQICDWAYYRDGECVGNYTVAVMLGELPERKRKLALKSLGWTESDLALRT